METKNDLNSNRITIDEIQKILLLLIEKLRNTVDNNIILKNDFYWNIASNQLYNPYTEPKDITLGQLSDDLSTVRRLLEHEDEALPHDLIKVAEIIKAIGWQVPPMFLA